MMKFNIRNYLLVIIAIILTLSSIAGFIHIGNTYFPVLMVFSLLLIAETGKKWHLGMGYVGLFLLACFISLVVNDVPSVFRPWSRLIVYSMVLLIVSPFIVSGQANKLRIKLLHYLLNCFVLLSIGSFIAYFMGINLFIHYGNKMEITDIGHFSGIMNHSIALGHFGGISAVYLLVRTLSGKGLLKIIMAISCICCYGACLFSASRNGIISCLIASIVVFAIFYRKRIFKGVYTLLLILVVAVSTFSLWGWSLDFVLEKNERNVELGENVFYSRENKFDARIAEFKKSPIIGIGYYAIDPDLDSVEFSTGQIEPGSSWLAIASMTGILGLLVFLSIFISSLRNAFFSQDTFTSTLLFSLLTFYFVHMISEGYIIAPRSIYTVVFWLIVSSAFYTKKSNKELAYGKDINL